MNLKLESAAILFFSSVLCSIRYMKTLSNDTFIFSLISCVPGMEDPALKTLMQGPFCLTFQGSVCFKAREGNKRNFRIPLIIIYSFNWNPQWQTGSGIRSKPDLLGQLTIGINEILPEHCSYTLWVSTSMYSL